MALEDYELGRAVDEDPDYADEHRSLRELPEEAYKIIEKNTPSNSELLYHGTRVSPKLRRGQELFMTENPGIAESYAHTRTYDRPNRSAVSADVDPLVVPLLLSKDEPVREIKGLAELKNIADKEGVDIGWDYGHALSDIINDAVGHLPERVFKMRGLTDVPVSMDLLDTRSSKFIRDTYGKSKDATLDYINNSLFEAVLRKVPEWYTNDASSLRRWKRGGRT